jgi:hypothetical protein
VLRLPDSIRVTASFALLLTRQSSWLKRWKAHHAPQQRAFCPTHQLRTNNVGRGILQSVDESWNRFWIGYFPQRSGSGRSGASIIVSQVSRYAPRRLALSKNGERP